MAAAVDARSLTPEPLPDQLARPMAPAELQRFEQAEARLREAILGELRAELELGRHLAELKRHPRMLWQRDPMLQTARGWRKVRSWHAYVKAQGMAESGKEADQLIRRWDQHCLSLTIANVRNKHQ
jgi:hypothetical protein